MDHARVVLSLSISVLLTGCNIGDDGGRQDAVEQGEDGDSAPVASNDVAASATVGPIRYQYDASELTLAEVLIDVPPDFDDQVWGAKLIPRERAAILGQDFCRYGQSGSPETCEAEKEAGLVLALLERPLSVYREAFVAEGLSDELSPAQLDGSSGFTFTEEAEGQGVEYHFLALQDRTVLVARQFTARQVAGGEAIQQVIRSVARGLEASGA